MDNRKSLTLPTLPPGWKKVLDSSTGRPYYFNEVTQESVWKPPRLSLFIESHDEPDDLPDPYFDEAVSINYESIVYLLLR